MTGEILVPDSSETTTQRSDNSDSEHSDYEPQFPPIVSLPEVDHVTLEEDEVVVLRLRAKLFRFDRSGDVSEWKERGIGEVKMLRHEQNKTVRIVMRRDKTLKVCANHFITPMMKMSKKPGGHDKVLIYMTLADFSYEEVLSECLAIKFATVDHADQFLTTFLEAQKFVQTECKLYNGENDESSGEECETNEENAEGDAAEVDKVAAHLETLEVSKSEIGNECESVSQAD